MFFIEKSVNLTDIIKESQLSSICLPGPSMSAFMSVISEGFWMIVIPIENQSEESLIRKFLFAHCVEFHFHMNNSEQKYERI